jgi:Rod binding domain-containing protein
MELTGLPMLPAATLGDPQALASRLRPGDPRAVDAAAKGLESLFASLLIKQMRQTLEPETMFGAGDSSDILGGLFDFTLGQHLVQGEGLGLAAMIRQQLATRDRT